MEYEASSLTLSKKLSNGHHSFAGTSAYDGVFASPSKKFGAGSPSLSSRAEDFREIFGGGSEASSIPFLDVPEHNEENVAVDIRSSTLDYSKIFGGGHGDSSFAVRYEELSQEPNRRKKSEEGWMPAQRLSPSEALENSSSTKGNYTQSPQASHQAFSGVKKFNMSYNKINNENANGTNGTTHIAQLNAVRGYACLIDEVTPLRRTGDKPFVSLVNDSCPKNNAHHQGVMEGNNFTRASKDGLASETVKQTPGDNIESRSSSDWFKSNAMGKSSNKFEIGRATHPKVPPSSSMRNFNFGNGDDRTDSNGGSNNAYSPSYFDEEVDTNSVAATSAAALRKAIEEAQAIIKVAKESMERKKAGLKNEGKLSFGERLKPEVRKEGNAAYGVNRSRKKKNHEPCEEVEPPVRASAGTYQVTAHTEVGERVSCSKNGETPWKEISSQVDRRCEEAEVSEAEQFYDVENTGEHWSPTKEADIPHVSAMTRNRSASGPGQVSEDIEVKKFSSGAKETDWESHCNELKSSQADCTQEKAESLEPAEQFYEFEEVIRVQTTDDNVQIGKIIAEEVFEKPQEGREELKPAETNDKPEEVEILTGINGSSECSKGGGELRLEVIEVFYHEKNEQKERFAPMEEMVQAFEENDKYERSPIEILEPLQNGRPLEIRGLEDTMHMKKAWECLESERNREEGCKPEENEQEQSAVCSLQDKKRMFINSAIKGERIKERFNGFHLGKEIAKILSHDVEAEGNEKILVGNVSQKEENENRHEESGKCVGVGSTNTKSFHSEGDDDAMKAAVEEPRNQGSNLVAADNTSKQDKNDQSENPKPVIFVEDSETLEISHEVPSCSTRGTSWRSMHELSKALLESNDSTEEEHDVEETDVLETDGFPQGLELTKITKPLEDKADSVFLDKNDPSDEGGIGTNFFQKPAGEEASQFEMVPVLREDIEKLASEIEMVQEESDVPIKWEDGENNTECIGERKWVDSATNIEEVQFSDISEGEGESVEIDESSESSASTEKDHEFQEEILITQNSEEREESQKETPLTQSVDRNEKKDQAAMPVEESKPSESLQKEVELEKERRRRIDEAKEREREIEKGRIAVERAVREARERAFAEACERAAAEKAATGSRQRVTTETRERVGKTSGELNAKTVAEKAREAKLKAERAAVERATAEARGRALEKAMSSKAASDARKHNPQHKGPTSTSTSRYRHSSNHGVSSFTERFDGANGESAQRCKARTERHQRISERAEKALAEKNRRDVLAQKEQAERNRLAETLDIEVKRWSSGKEGNLRALLSTLQYILGPDSGWQAIPLTDTITTTAVKKAYRKATLFVHPDKLQQRGANIQQKYTCEKVFDLLKEAWNKFNVEER